MAAHKHSYGPVFLHVETPKRACLICGFALIDRLVPRQLIAAPPVIHGGLTREGRITPEPCPCGRGDCWMAS